MGFWVSMCCSYCTTDKDPLKLNSCFLHKICTGTNMVSQQISFVSQIYSDPVVDPITLHILAEKKMIQRTCKFFKKFQPFLPFLLLHNLNPFNLTLNLVEVNVLVFL